MHIRYICALFACLWCISSGVVKPNVLKNELEQITIAAGYRPSALLILQQSVLAVKVFQGAIIQYNFIKINVIASILTFAMLTLIISLLNKSP